jgi:hypothetical protein
MKFVVVNGRRPSPESVCARCSNRIADSYLRDIATRRSYCDHKCYAGDRKVALPALQSRARAS